MNPTSKDRVELIARVYATNQDASRALGIESPWARRARRLAPGLLDGTEE